MNIVLIQFLRINHYVHWLTNLSIFISTASICREAQLGNVHRISKWRILSSNWDISHTHTPLSTPEITGGQKECKNYRYFRSKSVSSGHSKTAAHVSSQPFDRMPKIMISSSSGIFYHRSELGISHLVNVLLMIDC